MKRKNKTEKNKNEKQLNLQQRETQANIKKEIITPPK